MSTKSGSKKTLAIVVAVVVILAVVGGAYYYTTSTSAPMQQTTMMTTQQSSTAKPLTFVAILTAAPGVKTNATGEATFQLSADNQSLNYTLTVSNISNVFMAHIHLSPSMDIGVWLDPNPNTVASGGEAACVAVLSTPPGPISSCPGFMSGTFSGVLAQGTITAADLSGPNTCAACSGLSSPTMSALVTYIESGQTYVNVHTMQNPAGEIQGTIVPQS